MMMKKSLVVLTMVSLLLFQQAYAENTEKQKQTEAVTKQEIQNETPVIQAKEDTSDNELDSYVQEGYETVQEAFDKQMIAYITEDLDLLMAMIEEDPNVVFFGAGSKYCLVGKDEIKKAFKTDFTNIQDLKIVVPWLSIRGIGDVAWVNALYNMTFTVDNEQLETNARQSMIFKKAGDEWKIVNSHLSFSNIDKDNTEESAVSQSVKQEAK
jgi:hypothetical protein